MLVYYIMDEKLGDIFYTEVPHNLTRFYELAKDSGATKKKIREFYYEQPVNQILRKQNQKKKYTRISCPFQQPGCLQMDLMDIKKDFRQNSSYKYVLVIVDIFSRYMWAYKLKNKKPASVLPHLEETIDEFKKYYPKAKISMTLDDGGEFKGPVKTYMNDKNFSLFYANPKDGTKSRTQIVERGIRTLRERLTKLMVAKDSVKWIDYLDTVVKSYNNSTHASIGVTPHTSFISKKPRKTPIARKKQTKKSFKIGDTVRILEKKGLFDKGSQANKFSASVYEITKKEGDRYTIKNAKHGNVLRRTVLSREMLAAKFSNAQDKREKQKAKTKKRNKSDRRIRKQLGTDRDKLIRRQKRNDNLSTWQDFTPATRSRTRSGKN